MASAGRNRRSTESELRSVMRAQLGLITVRQLRRAGLSASAATRRVQAGLWTRPLPGVYRDTMRDASPWQSAFAAVLWAGESALVSHHAAGALWELGGITAERPELWTPSGRRLRSDLVVVHRGEVGSTDRRMIGPIPVTSPARTLIDLAGLLDEEALQVAVEDAIHRGLTTPTSVERRLDAIGGRGRPGTADLRDILRARGPSAAAESRLETLIWRTLRVSGMRPVRQHVVRCGERTYRIDCAFPQWRVGVEGVGDAFHSSALQRRRDHVRLADLVSISWRIIPVTWHDITTEPTRVVERVLRALAADVA